VLLRLFLIPVKTIFNTLVIYISLNTIRSILLRVTHVH
jgi:hypothetical protein